VHRADNRTTFMCRLSCNLGASTSWNPMGLSRPVMGLIYLYLFRNRLKGIGMDTSEPEQGKVAGTCNHGNEPSQERLCSVGLVN
jgi:hypothetical protein